MKIDSNVITGGFLKQNIIVDPKFIVNGSYVTFDQVASHFAGMFLSAFGSDSNDNEMVGSLTGAGARATPPVGYTDTVAYIVLKHIRIVNKTAGAVTFSLWLGATGGNAAGTEVIGIGKSVPANDAFDWYGLMRIDSADFLVGGAGAATSLTIQGEGEIGVSG